MMQRSIQTYLMEQYGTDATVDAVGNTLLGGLSEAGKAKLDDICEETHCHPWKLSAIAVGLIIRYCNVLVGGDIRKFMETAGVDEKAAKEEAVRDAVILVHIVQITGYKKHEPLSRLRIYEDANFFERMTEGFERWAIDVENIFE